MNTNSNSTSKIRTLAIDETHKDDATSALNSQQYESSPPNVHEFSLSSDSFRFLSPHATSKRYTSSSAGSNRGPLTENCHLESSNTPLMSGEDIFVLSFSNDTTPVAGHSIRNSSEYRNNKIKNAQISFEKVIDRSITDSPPPESVHSNQLSTLSPPPISLKSSGSVASEGGEAKVISNSVSSFGIFTQDGDGGVSRNIMYTNNMKQMNSNPPTFASVGGHTQWTTVGGVGHTKRPPLPPRWALQGNPAGAIAMFSQQSVVVAASRSGGLVDVVPSHLPPPKQVGSISHRRTVSTGDASLLSTLTDPDSIDESSPSLENVGEVLDDSAVIASGVRSGLGAAATVTGVFPSVQPFASAESMRRRGVSWDFGIYNNDVGESFEDINTLEAMGIMQPILLDNQEDQIPETTGVSTKRTMYIENITQQEVLTKSPSPPRSSQDMMKKHTFTNSLHFSEVSSENNVLRKKNHTCVLKHNTQNENDAPIPICEEFCVRKQPNHDYDDNTPASHESYRNNLDQESSEVQLVISAPSHSSLTSIDNLEENNPVGNDPSIYNLSQRGEMLFEDQGWHNEYDIKGRVDGSLKEAQDPKLLEEGLCIEVLPPVNSNQQYPCISDTFYSQQFPLHPSLPAIADAPVKPLQFLRAKTTTSGMCGNIEIIEGCVKYDQNESSNDDNDNEKKALVSEFGYAKRTCVVGMAEELASMASLDKNMIAAPQHKRVKSNVVSKKDIHGINNLLDGADLLYKRINGASDEDTQHHRQAVLDVGIAEDNSDVNEGNGPNDEETGRAGPKSHHRENSRAKLGSTRSSNSKNFSRSELVYHLGVWYNDLIQPKIPGFTQNTIYSFFVVFAPLLFVAFILYYAVGNPMAGKIDDMKVTIDSASWSWWILFLVRQFFILCCVKTWEVIVIDIFALRTPIFVKFFGSFITLMLVQARGWPYVLMFWGLMDFCFLFGDHAFAKHWLYWQDSIDLFNEKNPSGSFVYDVFYMRLLIAMITIGILTSLKRLWLSTFLGRRSYQHYGPELEIILAKMLLVSQVAHLARQIKAQRSTNSFSIGYGNAFTMAATAKSSSFPELIIDSEEDTPVQEDRKRTFTADSVTESTDGFGENLIASGLIRKDLSSKKSKAPLSYLHSNHMKKSNSTSKLEILGLLEEWEEPDFKFNSASKASIKDILQFRQAISLMDDDFCFTPAFGSTTTRALCVESSEALFNRLVEDSPKASHLPFEVLSQIAHDRSGTLMRDKVKALIKIFRPDRKGFMTKLDFINSVDSIYKDFRLFRANLQNSSMIDDSFESIINLVHYAILLFIVLLVIGFQVWETIVSFATFFFGFSFMFGPASSKYFEGILLIFVRRPYDIGDKIALSDPAEDTSPTGSSTWFVEHVTLYTTTVRFASTNEVATYSNGSLAQLRIINAKRSPKAILYVYMKFAADTPYKLIEVFKAEIEKFVKARPREWAQLNGIRPSRIEMELNYVEYVICATHREMWQNIGPIISSKADLASFSLEVSKQLNLRYASPPKPIHLTMIDSTIRDNNHQPMSAEGDLDSIANLFAKEDEE